MGVSSRSIPWPRILAEGFAIVVSILLAFGIQAWWEGRSDNVRREAMLAALVADFRLAQIRLDHARSDHETLATAGKRVLDFGETGIVPEDDREVFSDLVGSHFLRSEWNPPMGTLTSVLTSGRLDLVQNDSLVAALTGWSSIVDGFAQIEDEARAHFYDHVYPYLAERLDLEDLDKGFANYVEIPWEQGPTDAYLLATDREFLSIIYMHWVLQQNVLAEVNTAQQALDEITRLLDATAAGIKG